MPNKTYYYDGQNMKNIDPWHSDGAMWKYSSNAPALVDDDLYARVAAVYRAVNFTADALSNMPFAIVNQNGDEVDTSQEYHNIVGFLPYPRQVLRLWTQSLIVTNRAYGFQEKKGTRVTNLRYIAPATIAPISDTSGITGFKRTIGTQTTEYKIDPKGFCNIFYAFNLNWKEELLPGNQSPFLAMMNAAGIGYYADRYIRDFFERGGIKPTILTFEGVMNKDDMERVEGVWTKVIRGIYKYWGKVFNGKFDIKPIGEGIEALKDESVYDNALRNIAIAIGMPQDALLQNADSYATAQVHKSTWFADTLTPIAMSLAEPMNEQIFKYLGLRWEFRPEVSAPNMEEKEKRLNSASVLYDILSAGQREDADKAALEAMGVDLPQWFTWEKKEVETPPPPDTTPEQPSEPQQEETPSGQSYVEEKSVTLSAPALSLAALRELNNWQELAFRKLKRGQPLAFDWEPKDISTELAAAVKAKLDTATDENEIRTAFDVMPDQSPPPPDDGNIKALAAAINAMAEAMSREVKAEPTITPAPSFTVNLTAQMPAAGEPSVTFAPVIQPSEVVNQNNVTVTNEVQTPVVNVTNEVQPSDVEVTGPQSARVVRDVDGHIIGLQAQ